jgi:hypothetical protein
MSGRASAVANGYTPWYRAPAWRAGKTKSRTNGSRASSTYALMAPVRKAFWRTASKSVSLPMSTVTAMTCRPYFSAIHLIATEVSSPPEYARMTVPISCRRIASRV